MDDLAIRNRKVLWNEQIVMFVTCSLHGWEKTKRTYWNLNFDLNRIFSQYSLERWSSCDSVHEKYDVPYWLGNDTVSQKSTCRIQFDIIVTKRLLDASPGLDWNHFCLPACLTSIGFSLKKSLKKSLAYCRNRPKRNRSSTKNPQWMTRFVSLVWNCMIRLFKLLQLCCLKPVRLAIWYPNRRQVTKKISILLLTSSFRCCHEMLCVWQRSPIPCLRFLRQKVPPLSSLWCRFGRRLWSCRFVLCVWKQAKA